MCANFLPNTMTIYDDYAAYTAEYKAKYGALSVVLIEVGSFWELYDCDQHRGADMHGVCDLLNILVSRKNKNILEVSASNPEMAGFPSHALDKFIPILLEAGYTVVLVGQVTPPPNPKRAVTQVLSKGTYMEGAQKQLRNVVTALHLECLKDNKFYIGVAMSDVTTGKTWAQEFGSVDSRDTKVALDHVYAWLNTFNPCEIILSGDLQPQQQKLIYEHLSLCQKRLYDYMNVWDRQLKKPAIQNAIFSRAFKQCSGSMLTPLEVCGLERHPLAATALAQLLTYILEHNDTLVKALHMPTCLEEPTHMELSYNAAEQLDVTHLQKLLNRCATTMGRRSFAERLARPCADPRTLETSFDAIQCMLPQGFDGLQHMHVIGKRICDVERLYRRCQLGLLNPCEWVIFVRSLQVFNTELNNSEHLPSAKVITYIQEHLDLNVCSKLTRERMDENFFVPGAIAKADALQQEMSHIIRALNKLQNYAGIFKLERNDREGHYLTCTSKRYKQFLSELPNDGLVVDLMDHDGRSIVFTKSMQYTTLPTGTVKITFPELSRLSQTLDSHRDSMHECMHAAYGEFLNAFCANMEPHVLLFVKDVCEWDWCVTNALNAIEFGYVRPCIVSSDHSFFQAKGLRHPIVERQDRLCPFISNDVQLGVEHDHNGILLYGLNAAGKSTLMKAVGLCTLMAQAGMFVPCANLRLCPYQHIFTRIHHGDNIHRGQSTFMVEIGELRNILRRADQYSLVIGDELCSGTEAASAMGIVAAGVLQLAKKNASFVFATHLHDLVELSQLKDLMASGQLKVMHMHVQFDHATGDLIYDRVLREGKGSSMYGIEVCKALDMGDEFITSALHNRQEYMREYETVKLSNYNSNVVMHTCSVCLERPAMETHHIIMQKDADIHGHVIAPTGSKVHKNALQNLAPLCEACHDRVHAHNLHIEGYVQTHAGVKLMTTLVSKSDDVTDIESVVIEMKKSGLSDAATLDALREHHGVNWTRYKLQKTLKAYRASTISMSMSS